MKVAKFTGKKFDATQQQARKDAKAAAVAGNASANSVAALRVNVANIAKALGILPTT
jgi:hypothetical protein